MRADRFGNREAYRQSRIERGKRVLKHILHPAPQPGLARTVEPCDVLAVQADLPASKCSSRIMLRPVVDLPQPDSPTSASVSP